MSEKKNGSSKSKAAPKRKAELKRFELIADFSESGVLPQTANHVIIRNTKNDILLDFCYVDPINVENAAKTGKKNLFTLIVTRMSMSPSAAMELALNLRNHLENNFHEVPISESANIKCRGYTLMAGQKADNPWRKGASLSSADFTVGTGTDPKSLSIPSDWAESSVVRGQPNVTVIYHTTRVVEKQETPAIRTVPIHSLGSDTLSLKMPIYFEISEEYGEFIARIEELDLYSAGKTEALSINMLKDEIVTLYEQLKSEGKLGPLPRRWKAVLDDIIEEK